MTDLVGPIWDITKCLWGCSAKRVAYIRELEENLTSLRDAADGLHNLWLDVKRKVQVAENQQQQCLNTVSNWLQKVEVTENEVRDILQSGSQEIERTCCGGKCPKNFCASYKLGKMVTQKISEVQELIKTGDFGVVALDQEVPRALVDEMPLGKTVGLESAFSKLCTCFVDSNIGIVGLYGMGGVGKTTLLKQFNNEFLASRNDESYTVIWVADLMKMQQVILNKLQIPDDVWVNKTMDERAIVLYNILKKKKFVLLLDDVWQRIDLSQLGVPIPDNENKSKVIFTTRSEEVCSHMKANKRIKVECLASEKAFKLFKDNVGEDALNSHPDIPRLAQEVAEECKGLPLALCTIGRSMANKKTPDEWERTIKTLRSYPSRFPGMIDYVYLLLEFSYDNLPSDTHRFCFLLCSLYPEDYNMQKDELVQIWIGEGLLAEFDDDIYEARSQAEDIFSALKNACLLEGGDTEDCVKMHDVIRDMAQWLACDHGSKTKFLVKDFASSAEAKKHEKWKDVERISLWGSGSNLILGKVNFLNLRTMLVRRTQLRNIPSEIFGSSSSLKVLDLSDNRELKQLPAEIGKFVNLELLNLSRSPIETLPIELMNLRKLKFLVLNYAIPPIIPKDVISSLSSLQVFSALPPERGIGSSGFEDASVVLRELESLENIKEISIALYDPSSVEILCSSPKLQGCMKHLYVVSEEVTLNISLNILEKMKRLEVLGIYNIIIEYIPQSCNGYTIGLRQLWIYSCEMSNLNWLIYARRLEFLEILSSSRLEEIIGEDCEVNYMDIFRSLTTLRLSVLDNLKSICRQALQFPCLKEIQVERCPSLTMLPFDSKSATNRPIRIKGDQSWWDHLQWEDEAIKNLFGSKFVAYQPYLKKVVLKVDLYDARITGKVMKAVCVLSGVESVSVDMKDKKLTLIGDIDPVDVVEKLRKLCYTEILSVGPAKEEKKKKDARKYDQKKEADQKKDPKENLAAFSRGQEAYYYYPMMMRQQPYPYYYRSVEEDPNNCVIC